MNHFKERPLPLIHANTDQNLDISSSVKSLPAASTGLETISLESFKILVENNSGLVIDVRPKKFYTEGHIPGAISFSSEDFNNALIWDEAMIGNYKDRLIVVYCSDVACHQSLSVGDSLLKAGYRKVLIFQEGWISWWRAGLPIEK